MKYSIEDKEILQRIKHSIDNHDIAKVTLLDLAENCPFYDGGYRVSPEALTAISSGLSEHGLQTEPSLENVLLPRSVDTPLFVFNKVGHIDHEANHYRFALLAIRVAVLMTKVDRQILDEEINRIKKILWGQVSLSVEEKIALWAKANFYLAVESGVGSERDQQYAKLASDIDVVSESLKKLSDGAQKLIIDIAIQVSLADGSVDKAELNALKIIYKALGMEPARVRGDIQRVASEKRISFDFGRTMILESEPEIEESVLDEIDDVFGDLISEFEF